MALALLRVVKKIMLRLVDESFLSLQMCSARDRIARNIASKSGKRIICRSEAFTRFGSSYIMSHPRPSTARDNAAIEMLTSVALTFAPDKLLNTRVSGPL